MSRSTLLSEAWSEHPVTVHGRELRPMTAASFELLQRLENPLVVGGDRVNQAEAMRAAVFYIWIHSAPLEEVMAVRTLQDLPAAEIRRLEWEIPIQEIIGFMGAFKQQAERMAAAMAEPVPEGDEGPGKPEKRPIGSPPSSSPPAPQEIPPASGMSFGAYPSSEPSPICTLPMLPREPAAHGSASWEVTVP